MKEEELTKTIIPKIEFFKQGDDFSRLLTTHDDNVSEALLDYSKRFAENSKILFQISQELKGRKAYADADGHAIFIECPETIANFLIEHNFAHDFDAEFDLDDDEEEEEEEEPERDFRLIGEEDEEILATDLILKLDKVLGDFFKEHEETPARSILFAFCLMLQKIGIHADLPIEAVACYVQAFLEIPYPLKEEIKALNPTS